METKENSLNLHFDNIPANQQRLINFLKHSYSEEEIYALGRMLNLEKEDYVGKGITKQQLCGSFVEMVTQRSLYEGLFVLLESPTYVRTRIYQEFGDLGIKEPLAENKLEEIVQECFEQSKIRLKDTSFSDWLADWKRSMVLVLGKDNTPEAWDKLTRICDVLREMGYSPYLIKDQPDIGLLTNEEKMLAYAAASRFVVIEKSEPSGHIDEAHICATNRLVGIWLREEGKGDTLMQGDYEVSFLNIKSFTYGIGNMSDAISTGVDWAEGYLKEKETKLNSLYPFRR
ncbi:hypothetical protein [Paenibacillus physcomitrellae]|uniref:Uncharacterized protein n=1 Tax=Paenibacillus physcomitrellae TaxID=1619311 RepID=A0ABQ1GSW5_9BACL|nr:hypothetical protein [Paenibacillus physcomitrellae]GGA49812.1 hypothetical protein GCM10010917_38880 [Paenibacillus physcomitrellae]